MYVAAVVWVRAAVDNARALLKSEWRLAALLGSVARSMRSSMGLLGTCVAAETKEAHDMHQSVACVKGCIVVGTLRCWMSCLEDGSCQ